MLVIAIFKIFIEFIIFLIQIRLNIIFNSTLDGHKRTVDYTADPHNGFNAVVHREPLVHKVAPVVAKVAAPVAYHAAPAHYAHSPIYHH